MQNIRHRGMQSGWTMQMRDAFIDYIKQKGKDNVNVSHMVQDLAPLGRQSFPGHVRKEMVDALYNAFKHNFTIDDSVTPITDPDNPNSEAEKTFLYQSRDVKPDPGLGVGVEVPDSPTPGPSPGSSGWTAESSTPRGSRGFKNSKTVVVKPIAPQQNSSKQKSRQKRGRTSSKQGQGSGSGPVAKTNVASAARGAASVAGISSPQQPVQPPLPATQTSSSKEPTSKKKVKRVPHWQNFHRTMTTLSCWTFESC